MTAPAGFAIRRAAPADGAAIRDVHVAAILGLGEGFYTLAELQSWAAGLTSEGYGRAMTQGGETMDVALDPAGRVVAFCAWKGDEVCAVYVHPDASRQGLGSTLLGRAESAIAGDGHRTVRIGASLSGQPLYLHHGYRIVAEKAWTTRGGLVIAAVDMERSLAP